MTGASTSYWTCYGINRVAKGEMGVVSRGYMLVVQRGDSEAKQGASLEEHSTWKRDPQAVCTGSVGRGQRLMTAQVSPKLLSPLWCSPYPKEK